MKQLRARCLLRELLIIAACLLLTAPTLLAADGDGEAEPGITDLFYYLTWMAQGGPPPANIYRGIVKSCGLVI